MKLSIWVTKTCNMACSYCYEEGLIREDTGVCEIDYIEKTIEFINTMCYKTASKKIFIKFFGGEPLIKFPFIKKFVEIANEKIDDKITPFYSITTNGTLMTDDMLIWLKKNNVECALSIDGDEEIYSINRRYKNRSSAVASIIIIAEKFYMKFLKNIRTSFILMLRMNLVLEKLLSGLKIIRQLLHRIVLFIFRKF